MILIKNGRVIENNKLVYKDILVDGKIIKKKAPNIICDEAEIIDVKGMLVVPGGVDPHVHFREPGFEKKETIKTGTLASAKGGITTCMPMPNLNPAPDNRENVINELNIIKKDALINCYPYGTITIGELGKEPSKVDEFHDLKNIIEL